MRVGPVAIRDGRGDRGASFVEYAGLVVLACLLLTGLVASGLPARITGGTSAAICRVFSPNSGDCGPQGPQSNSGGPGQRALPAGQQNGNQNPGHDPAARPSGNPVTSFFHGVWHGLTTGDAGHPGTYASAWSGAGDLLKGVAGSLTDAVSDVLDFGGQVVTDPGGTLSQIWHGFADPALATGALVGRQWAGGHPIEAIWTGVKGVVVQHQNTVGLGSLYHAIIDDKTTQLWNSGHKAQAVGRALTNGLLTVTPGGSAGKVAKILGVARGVEDLSKLSRVTRVARDAEKSARDAKNASKNGDLVGAKKAADTARRKAEQAKQAARAAGCTGVALGMLPVHIGGRMAAPTAAPSKPDPQCIEPTEAEKEAADAAKKVQRGLVDPAHVRFTQNNCGRKFKNGKSVYEAIRELKKDPKKADDYPPVAVMIRNGKVYSFDNRRLYVFKQAGVKIRYRLASPQEIRKEFKKGKFSTDNDGTSIQVR